MRVVQSFKKATMAVAAMALIPASVAFTADTTSGAFRSMRNAEHATVASLINDQAFVTSLINDRAFVASLINDRAFVTSLINDRAFVTSLINDRAFVVSLIND